MSVDQASRPERADKARNRVRILAAASTAFAETGIDTQMDAIAARAGVGVGTLYRHFATKDALLVALLERKFDRIVEITRDAVDHGRGEAFEVLADTLRAGAEIGAADAAVQEVLAHSDRAVWDQVEPTLRALTEVTQILIDRAQAAGTARPDISADDISMFMCGASAVMVTGHWDYRRYLEIVLDGMRTQPPRG